MGQTSWVCPQEAVTRSLVPRGLGGPPVKGTWLSWNFQWRVTIDPGAVVTDLAEGLQAEGADRLSVANWGDFARLWVGVVRRK